MLRPPQERQFAGGDDVDRRLSCQAEPLFLATPEPTCGGQNEDEAIACMGAGVLES